MKYEISSKNCIVNAVINTQQHSIIIEFINVIREASKLYPHRQTLIIELRDQSPFLTKTILDQLADNTKHDLLNWEVDINSFNSIVITAYVRDDNNQWIWYTVTFVDQAMMSQLRELRIKKTKMLAANKPTPPDMQNTMIM